MTSGTDSRHAAPVPVTEPPSLPAPGLAEVRIIAADPETARQIAEVLRLRFAADEQRSYPAGDAGDGTRLHLTVDTVHIPRAHGPSRLRLVTDHPHADEL